MDEYDRLVADALATPLSGWDWAVMDGRCVESPPPWDERAMVRAHLPSARSLLDLGTGGGERLSMLAPLPDDTVATEAYPPNVPVARERLEPLGIEVVALDDDGLLPFDGERFDLVIARHESFDPAEVRRVLRPGGTFVTQQVGGQDLRELNEALGKPDHAYAGWDQSRARDQLELVGLEIVTADETLVPVVFHDIGAIVWFCRVTPWQVPGFSVTDDDQRLRDLHRHIQRDGRWQAHGHRFVIEARRPG